MISFYIKNFGKIPLCNKTVSRGFFIGKFCFPICTRCSAICASYIIFYYLFLYYISIDSYVFLIISLLLSLPTAIDYLIQAITKKESSNIKRVITGSLAGIGLAISMLFFENHFKI